ncbi:MAG: 50S ribosomal protein L4 [Candidatus Micrarchaeota archaeon]
MKAKVIGINGNAGKEIDLPEQFEEQRRADIVRRAVHAEQTARFQPKGVFLMAGLQTTAEYYGRRHAWRQTINTGRSRVPREKIPKGRMGRVLRIPSAMKGRRAHPPKPWKRLRERINVKEKNFAMRSAISATASAEEVKARGHVFSAQLPIIVDNSIEGIAKSKEAHAVLEKLGLGQDMLRARERRRMRSGRSRLRKGGYRTPKTVLIVIGEDKGIWRAARNIPGVDVAKVGDLTAELLAPGGNMGRLTVWTESSIDRLQKDALFK